jgi:hypothetical protein
MTLRLIPSEFPYAGGKFDLIFIYLFYQCVHVSELIATTVEGPTKEFDPF